MMTTTTKIEQANNDLNIKQIHSSIKSIHDLTKKGSTLSKIPPSKL